MVRYTTRFHRCATDGVVGVFVIDKAEAAPAGATLDAGIDIQPFQSSTFGREVYGDLHGDGTVTADRETSG